MTLFHSNIILLVRIGTNCLVELPTFSKINENFSHKHFLVPQNLKPEHSTCKKNYYCSVALVASRLKNRSCGTSIISPKAKEEKYELELDNKSLDDSDMILSVIERVFLRLGRNSLSHGPTTLINGLKASPSGSCEDFINPRKYRK